MTHRFSGLEMWLTRNNLAANNPWQSSCHCFRKDQRKKKHLCRDEKTENYWLKNQTGENFEIWFRLYQGFFDKWSQKCLKIWSTSMLVTDVEDQMCWRQVWDVGDSFGRFFTSIEILSLTSKNCHQDKVTNIHLSPKSM